MHDLSLGRRAQHVKAQIEDAIAYTRQPQQQPAQQPQPPSPLQQGAMPQGQGPQPMAPPSMAMPQQQMAPRPPMPAPAPQQGGLGSLPKQPQSFARGGLVRSVQSRNFPV